MSGEGSVTVLVMAIVVWWESVGLVALPWVALRVERWALVMGVAFCLDCWREGSVCV